MEFIAHISEDKERTQSVKEHTDQTAEYCGKFSKNTGLENLCCLSGLLHDAGKLSQDFNDYILGENTYKRGDIDHSFAGAKYIHEFAEENSLPREICETSNFIARVIVSHHGLHDWVDVCGNNYFDQRISKNDRYSEIKNNIKEIIDDTKLKELLKKASEEYASAGKKIKELSNRYETKEKKKTSFAFYMGLLERYVQSVLVDSDRCNTADFMTNGKYKEIECDTKALWTSMNAKMEDKYNDFRKKTDEISKQRMSISDRCGRFADNHVETCRLVVPTGGGKTLSSLRFAIKYALKNNKKKIIYIAPFMSILEQNSDVISAFIDDKNLFTEHYSDAFAKADTKEELDNLELRCERLDSPVIAATFVQFLNSLFLGSMSAVRRFHRLENSVIIIDEVQSIPIKCVCMFNLAINFLTQILNCTVVLCTATQPSLEALDYPILFDTNNSMTGDFSDDFKKFRRTEIVSEIRNEGYTFKQAAEFCMDRFAYNNSLLLIVNTKKAAFEIFNEIKSINDSKSDKAVIIHLSTNMCPQHRRDKLKIIRELLDNHQKVICISTQLIEAGVDVSFECTVRSLSGLDNIAQAAGRCNRNGEKASADVYVINITEENLSKLPEIQCRANIGREIFEHNFENILEDKVVNRYFQKFYGEQKENLLFPCDENKTNLVEMLSTNKRFANKNKKPFYSNQAFATAGNLFKAIDNNSFQILVPYNEEARQLICDLGSEIPIEDFRLVLKKMQKYMVNTYNLKSLIKNEALDFKERYNIYTLKDCYYSDEFGLTADSLYGCNNSLTY